MRFLKPKEEPASAAKDSFNYLKQFGTPIPFAHRKSEEKKDIFKIPEFKAKQDDTTMSKSKSDRQNITSQKAQRNEYVLAEIPSYKEKLPKRMSDNTSESSQEKKKAIDKQKEESSKDSSTNQSSFKKKNLKVMLKSIPSKYQL